MGCLKLDILDQQYKNCVVDNYTNKNCLTFIKTENKKRSNYLYGYNGKELDDRDGLIQYDYGFRIYDPRLARFKSVDPLTQSYPWYTPYQFAGNKPILCIDLDGLEEFQPDLYNVDMAKCPDTYTSVSGKITQTSYNAHGWPVNYSYFWDQVLKQAPDALDPVSKEQFQKYGRAPRVTKALIKTLDANGFNTTGLVEGEVMQHHHINQGRNAVAIGSKNHSKIPKFTTAFKTSVKSGRFLGSLLNVFSVSTEILGYFTGNPDALINAFGAAEIGKVKKDILSETYYTITKISKESDKDGGHTDYITYDTYASTAYDQKQGKYIGTGYIGTYTEWVSFDKDGKKTGSGAGPQL